MIVFLGGGMHVTRLSTWIDSHIISRVLHLHIYLHISPEILHKLSNHVAFFHLKVVLVLVLARRPGNNHPQGDYGANQSGCRR